MDPTPKLALIPFKEKFNPNTIPNFFYIDALGVSHIARPITEVGSTQGELIIQEMGEIGTDRVIPSSKFTHPVDPFEIHDEPSESNRTRKGKRKVFSPNRKKQGKSLTLTGDVIATIMGIPNFGWCHYVKRNWPPLDGLPNALEISRRFSNDPTLEEYIRIDKDVMLFLHKLFFDVVHKVMVRRKQKRTEANYLYHTLMELLIFKHPITLPKMILIHMHHICV
ncbi:hypothetical protein H5410_015762 [Solanum commersonii]|uniref:Uncharacterized protein n=1 Tax=Solanum commersonii TaxID=4109 RepID=A0A9J5ZVD1_SOLCO|nr:hypothetical protein H5410_015762 [Solanum commersonii]